MTETQTTDARAEAQAIYARLQATASPEPVEAEAAPEVQEKPAPSLERARGDDGKFVGLQTKEQSEKPVAAPSEEPKPEDVTARTRALTALRRAKVPQSVLDSLGDEALREWGIGLAEDQAKVDRLLRSKGKPVPETPTDPKADKASGTPEFGADLEGLGYSKEEQQAFSAPIQELLAQNAQQAAVVRDMLANSARTELSGEYPELKDPDVWRSVRAKAIELLEPDGAYEEHEDMLSGAQAVIRDAIRIVRPRLHASKAPSRIRDAGSPLVTPAADHRSAYKGMTYSKVVMSEMQQGRTPVQARELAEQLGLTN